MTWVWRGNNLRHISKLDKVEWLLKCLGSDIWSSRSRQRWVSRVGNKSHVRLEWENVGRLDSLLDTLHGELTFQKTRTSANVKHFGRCWSANAIEFRQISQSTRRSRAYCI